MRPGDHYNLHWPIRRGRFNIHNNLGGTLSAIMQDLEDLWSMAIEKYLDIPIKDLQVSTFRLYYYYLSDFKFSFVIQVNLDMTDSMGPGKLVRHMQNPSYTYDEYLICIGLGPSILSVIC